MHVRRANEQIVGGRMRDGRQRPHGTRRDDHAGGREGTRCDARADVVATMDLGGATLEPGLRVRADLFAQVRSPDGVMTRCASAPSSCRTSTTRTPIAAPLAPLSPTTILGFTIRAFLR